MRKSVRFADWLSDFRQRRAATRSRALLARNKAGAEDGGDRNRNSVLNFETAYYAMQRYSAAHSHGGKKPPAETVAPASGRRLLLVFVLLRLGADDAAMHADAFVNDYIEALAVLVRPDRSDFPPDAFLAFFLRRADDKSAVGWFAAHGVFLSLMGCMIAADAPALARETGAACPKPPLAGIAGILSALWAGTRNATKFRETPFGQDPPRVRALHRIRLRLCGAGNRAGKQH